MDVMVELAGRKLKVALPDAVPAGQAFPLKVDGVAVTATWIRHAALLVLRDGAGVERHVRLRSSAVSRFDGEPATQVSLEASSGAAVHCLRAVVHPDVPGHTNRVHAAGAGGQLVRSQITGKVLKVLVRLGDVVESGQALLIIEAMKMENRVFSQAAGTVASLSVKDGDAVQTGKELLRIGK